MCDVTCNGLEFMYQVLSMLQKLTYHDIHSPTQNYFLKISMKQNL